MQFNCCNRCIQVSIGNHSLELRWGAFIRYFVWSRKFVLIRFRNCWWKNACVCLWGECLTPRNAAENIAFCVYFLTVYLLIVEKTLWVRLVLPGVLVKFVCHWLRLASDNFVFLFENSVMVMCQVAVDLLSTTRLMHFGVHLIRVSP